MSLLCILGYFLKVNVQNENIFRAAKISNIVLGCLIFPMFLAANGSVDAGPDPAYEENVRVPPPPPPPPPTHTHTHPGSQSLMKSC